MARNSHPTATSAGTATYQTELPESELPKLEELTVTRPDLTVTDINVALGYVDPDYFLGGTMKLVRIAP